MPGCGCRGSSGKWSRGPGSGLAAVTRRGAPRGSLGCGLSGRPLGQAAAGNRVRGRLCKVTGRARKGSRASRGRAHPLPRAQVRPAARGAAFAASQPGRAPWEPSRSHSSSQRHGEPGPRARPLPGWDSEYLVSVPVSSLGGARSPVLAPVTPEACGSRPCFPGGKTGSSLWEAKPKPESPNAQGPLYSFHFLFDCRAGRYFVHSPEDYWSCKVGLKLEGCRTSRSQSR